MSFESFGLDARLRAGIQDAGFTAPTPIQEQAIPHLLRERDLLGLAQTGTGKTAAFVLPILQRLLTGPLRRVRVLIVAPTRELAEQIHQTIAVLGRHTRVRSTTVYGGVSKGRQVEALRRGVEIVVACPGRLLDLAGEGNIDLSQVEVLVLDEADRLCDMGFLPDVRRILRLLPARRQTLFFSATMPDEVRELADTILREPLTVQIGLLAPAKTVSHALYPVTQNLKQKLLLALLERTARERVLVFTRTKRRARFLARDLALSGYNASALQGNMSQNKRQAALDAFRSGDVDILVATDIAARGLDVADISHVINFDMPDTVDAYTHRIGRTGRAEETGEAYTFAAPDDAALVRDIERTLRKPLERRTLPGFDYGDFNPRLVAAETPDRPVSARGSHGARPSGYGGQRGRQAAPGSSPKNRAYAGRKRGQDA